MILPNSNCQRLHKYISICYIILDGVLLRKFIDKANQSAKQDQIARVSRLLLLYTQNCATLSLSSAFNIYFYLDISGVLSTDKDLMRVVTTDVEL